MGKSVYTRLYNIKTSEYRTIRHKTRLSAYCGALRVVAKHPEFIIMIEEDCNSEWRPWLASVTATNVIVSSVMENYLKGKEKEVARYVSMERL